MSLILGIETSGSICSVAVSNNNKLLGKFINFLPNSHDRLLADYIFRITKDLKIEINELSAIALSAGPGSFTGLRIGASLAKSLTFEEHPKLIAIPTLEAIAYSGIEVAKEFNYNYICSSVQSYKDQFYYQKFDLGLNKLSDIEISSTEDFIFDGNVLYVGYNKNKEQSKIDQFIKIFDSEIIVNLAFEYYYQNKFTNSENFTPIYVQEFVPKIKTN